MIHVSDVAAHWAQGFQVVRLWPYGKNPLDKHFQHPEMRMTPEQAREAWSASEWHQRMNLGVIPLSGGCVVIDCDGAEAIAHFEARFGHALETMQVESTRSEGGRHYWYTVTGVEGWRTAGWSAKLAGRSDVDVKARGFALVPPSSNELAHYVHVNRLVPAPMPADLVSACTGSSGSEGPRLDIGEVRAALSAWQGPEAAEEYDLGWYRDIAGSTDQRKFLIRRALEEGVPAQVVRAAAKECGREQYADDWAEYSAGRN